VADRDAAFGHWLDHAGCHDPALRAELIALDADGTCPRPAFLRAAGERLGRSLSLGEYRAVTLAGFPRLRPEVEARLSGLRRDGWRIAVVTNGDAGVQERTVERIGLTRFLDACVVSGAVGVRKPDPAIFRLAIGDAPGPVWMVGDSVVDIAGARAAGVSSIWVARGRTWTATGLRPDAIAADLEAALERVDAISPHPPSPHRPSARL
jgi:HAD superfamily hydrolase (TIGR01509 family)